VKHVPIEGDLCGVGSAIPGGQPGDSAAPESRRCSMDPKTEAHHHTKEHHQWDHPESGSPPAPAPLATTSGTTGTAPTTAPSGCGTETHSNREQSPAD